VQPTLKIRVGYRFNVRVNRDILFDGLKKLYLQPIETGAVHSESRSTKADLRNGTPSKLRL
jgi:hypothetical protein